VRSPALWLALKELGARRGRVALAVLVVAAIAAAVTATELVARTREAAVAAQIDEMGPALTVVPRGVTAGALARLDLGEGVLPPGAEAAVKAALAGELRALEGRLVLQREVTGSRGPVIGVEPGALPDRVRGSGTVALGSELARRVGDVSSVVVAGREHRVGGVLPSTGSGEDLAVLMSREALRALAGVEGSNALRLFLRAGVSPRDAEARIARSGLGAAVVRHDRGDVADREAQEALSRHRGVAYAVMAIVAGLCLLIAAHLDAAERRVEVATLVAIGASRWTLLGALLSRSALVAATGAAMGATMGAAVAVAQAPALAAAVAMAWPLTVSTVAAALVLGVVAAAPTALASILRDPVSDLQES
jgi:putative ABC transport system permease protein